MSNLSAPTVLDCMVYAQALINPASPAGRCVEIGIQGQFTIVLSQYVVSEILELPQKLPPKFAITDARVAEFLEELLPAAHLCDTVPHVFEHPIDPDDSPYVDLALATGANLIVSRDRHLLGLSDAGKPWSDEFRRKYPDFKVLTPELFLASRPQVP